MAQFLFVRCVWSDRSSLNHLLIDNIFLISITKAVLNWTSSNICLGGEQHENRVSLILTDSSHRLAKRRYAVMWPLTILLKVAELNN